MFVRIMPCATGQKRNHTRIVAAFERHASEGKIRNKKQENGPLPSVVSDITNTSKDVGMSTIRRDYISKRSETLRCTKVLYDNRIFRNAAKVHN